MQLTEVKDAATKREFILANVLPNRQNPHYIRPLDKDVESVFSPQTNKAFRHGECIRWVLKNNNGQLIGRIAAFVNSKYRNKGDDMKVGGMGFFDCINDQQAADMLFDVAKHWLMQKGMEAMDGPINFGERDRWWGLVVEGFQEPLYGMNYNPPYYRQLVENYGFKPFFNQICFGLDPLAPLKPRLFERHAMVARDPGFRAVHINKDHLKKYAADFATIYNAAWAQHGGMKELRTEQVLQMFHTMKPVMDENIIWFVYHHDRPVAVLVNLPDLNQWFKYLNGRFDIWGKLKFFWLKRTKTCKKFTGLVFGIVPEYQGKGVDSYMAVEASRVLRSGKLPYTEYEMQWIGDFNPRMLNVAEHLGDVSRSRILTTYRYLFDRTREFRPHPVLL